MKCPKCGSEKIALVRDTRGLPEAHCAECDAYIKKMSTAEAITFYEEKVAQLTALEQPAQAGTNREMKCRYCTESYFTRHGRMGTVYYPVDIVYCPMCGRKVQPDDKKY